MAAGVITITIKCDLDSDEIFGRVHVQTTEDKTLDWLLSEFCEEKRVRRKPTFALRRQQGGGDLDLNLSIAQSGLHDGENIVIYNKEPPPLRQEPIRPSKDVSNWWILAGIALLIGGAGIVAVVVIKTLTDKPIDSFGLMIDAGSSSSKIYVYTWPAEKYKSTNGIVSQKAFTKSNISIESPDGLKSLTAHMNEIVKVVPEKRRSHTFLYLGATAGMRLYRALNITLSDAVLNSARKLFTTNYGFKIVNSTEQIRIISGIEEGLSAWVSVNYLKNSFGDLSVYGVNSPAGRTLPSSFYPMPVTPEKTFGSLDLGGASTQIAFVPSTPSSDMEHVQTLKLYGESYPVYSYSFLCYGKAEAELRALARIIVNENFATGVPISFPCWQSGKYDTVSAAEVFKRPCSDLWFTVPENKKNATFLIQGGGDSAGCRLLVSRFFNQTICDKSSCSFNNVFQPDPSGVFLAFSSFYYVTDFFNVTAKPSRPQANLTTLTSRVDSYCSKPWSEAKVKYAVSEDLLSWYCFDGIYVEVLLRVFGFNETNWYTLRFVDTIPTPNPKQPNSVVENNVSWSLGFMILMTGHIASELPSVLIGMILFISLLILFCLLIVLAITFACVAKRRRTNGYRQMP